MTTLDYRIGEQAKDPVSGRVVTVVGYYRIAPGGPYPWAIRYDDGTEGGAMSLDPLDKH